MNTRQYFANGTNTIADANEWSLEKLRRNMERPRSGKRCVLLSTGSLNPIHLGHVAILDWTRHHLEMFHGFEVVGAFLSPSHDNYLDSKYGTGKHLDAKTRVSLCKATTQDHPVIDIPTWESSDSREYWPEFTEVTENLVQILCSEFPTQELQVFYVCGSDHYKVARYSNLPGICVISREKDKVTAPTSNNTFVIPTSDSNPYSHLSASLVRETHAARNLNQLRTMVAPPVYDFLTR